jgi:hypothetical protein
MELWKQVSDTMISEGYAGALVVAWCVSMVVVAVTGLVCAVQSVVRRMR